MNKKKYFSLINYLFKTKLRLFLSIIGVVLLTSTVLANQKYMHPDIETLLFDKNVVKRRIAAHRLANYRTENSLIALLEGLHDEDNQVRKNCVRSLGILRDSRAVPFLLELTDDDDSSIRNEVVRSLGMIKSRIAIKYLIKVVQKEENIIRLNGIWSLTQLKDKRALPVLVDLLFDQDKDIRSASALALGDFEDRRVIPFLRKVYSEDKNLRVRQNAAFSLRKLGVNLNIPTEQIIKKSKS